MEKEHATRFIHELLELLVKEKGSDLFVTAAFPPAIKVDGKITPVSKTTLSPQHTSELVRSVINVQQAAGFEPSEAGTLPITPPGAGRPARARTPWQGPRTPGKRRALQNGSRYSEGRPQRPPST